MALGMGPIADVNTQSFGVTQLVSASVVVALLLIAGLVTKVRAGNRQGTNRDRGGLVMGWDLRLSTSKTIAVAWTAVIVFMVLTLVLIATSQPNSFLMDVLNKTPDLYLVFLGGPFAAAVLVKVGVTQNAQTGKLQKSDGNGTLNPLDLISNDGGATDLYDFQYTLFNLIAIVAVLSGFLPHPAVGLPVIPDFLAILTGGSALTYTVNKTVTTNSPSVTGVSPARARLQDVVTLQGANLYDPNAASGTMTITVGGVAVPAAQIQPFSDHVAFRVPPLPPGPQTIAVITNAGTPLPTDPPISVTVVPDNPVVNQLSAQHVTPGASLTLYGRYIYPAPQLDWNGHPANPVGDTTIELTLPGGVVACPVDPAQLASDSQVTVTIPPELPAPLATALQPAAAAQPQQAIALTIRGMRTLEGPQLSLIVG